jgi:hypothetical protein
MSLVLQSSGGGQITIQEPATASNFTQTLPAADGVTMVSGNMPAFSAYNSANQTLTNNTWTKVNANIEVFDTNSNYDNVTNYRFLPTVAGYYQVNASVRVTATVSILLTVVGIYKNGTSFVECVAPPFASSFSNANVSAVMYLNGTTDYIELYAYSSATGTITLDTNLGQTFINASMVRAA